MQRTSLIEALRAALEGRLNGHWVYFAPGELNPVTPCLLIDDMDDPEVDELDRPVDAVRSGFTHMAPAPEVLEQIAESARLLEDPPSDGLLVKALVHYLEFDAFLSTKG